MGEFRRVRYPDGQIGAVWEPGKYDGNPLARRKSDFVLTERINNYEDLMFVRACADVLLHQGVSWRCFIPCLFGQRSDRRFTESSSFDLKLITDVINSCDFEEVEIFDPHSDVSMALINNSVKRSSFKYVEKTVKDLTERGCEELLLVSPDAGAYKKVFDFGERLGLPVMGAMKHRDTEGNITLMFTHDVSGKDCLIVDDLCDGGYTFEILAKDLKKHGANTVFLYVSHGLFSKGFVGLHEAGINGIYCTNSVKDLNPPYIIKHKTSEDMYPDNATSEDYVTQYEII